jgi:aminoglycoside/choline kinase family phosphotransferase
MGMILGHRGVCKKEMLHRDISMSNILLGNPEAAEGNRGLLIDFDSAAHGADGTVEAEKSTVRRSRSTQYLR